MTEKYACSGCGTVFVPGTGPDNIHEAEAGVSKTPHRGHDLDHVSKHEAEVYEAFRAGKCPVCRLVCPMMTEVS